MVRSMCANRMRSSRIVRFLIAIALLVSVIPSIAFAQDSENRYEESVQVDTDIQDEETSADDEGFENVQEVTLPPLAEDIEPEIPEQDNIAKITKDANQVTLDGCMYQLNNGILTVSGSGSVPDYLLDDAYPIDDTLISWLGEIHTIVIGSNVSSVGQYAFSGMNGDYEYTPLADNLKRVEIQSGSTTFATGAFSDCYSLQTVVFPANMHTIGFQMFRYCESLNIPIFPSTLTRVEFAAFDGCQAFSGNEITLPESCVSVGSNAFTGTNLKTVTLLCPENDGINKSAFDASTKLVYPNVVVLDNGCFKSNGGVFRVSGTGSTLTISVVKAANDGGTFATADLRSFLGTSDAQAAIGIGLASVNSLCFGDGITDVPSYFFHSSAGTEIMNALIPNVTSIIVGPSVATIGDAAFWYSGISSCVFETGSRLSSIGDNAFANTNLASLDLSPTKLTALGSTQTSGYTIGGSIFGSSSSGQGYGAANINIANIVLPSTLHTLGVRAFSGCVATTNYTIPAQITNVYAMAFDGVTWQNGSHLIVTDTVKTFTPVTAWSQSSGDIVRNHFDQIGSTSVEFNMVKTPESVARFPGYSSGNASYTWSGYQVTLDPNNGEKSISFIVKSGENVNMTVFEGLKAALPANSKLKMTDNGQAACDGKFFRSWTRTLGTEVAQLNNLNFKPTDMLDLSIDWSNVLKQAGGKNVPDESDDAVLSVLTYNGAQQKATACFAEGENAVQATAGSQRADSTIAAKDAGTYVSAFEPKDGYCWPDGTMNARTYKWQIRPAPLMAVYTGGTALAGQTVPLKVTVSGFKGTDSPSTIEGYVAPTVSLPADFALKDTYLMPSGGNAGNNYEFTYLPGLLKIMLGTTTPTQNSLDSAYRWNALQPYTNMNGTTGTQTNGNSTSAGSTGTSVARTTTVSAARYGTAAMAAGGISEDAYETNSEFADENLSTTGLAYTAAPAEAEGGASGIPWFAYIVIPLVIMAAIGIATGLIMRRRAED